MDTLSLQSFLQQNDYVATRLIENTDPHGMHMEYRNTQGVVFAQVAKIYKKSLLFGLIHLDSSVHAEVKDASGNLLLTTTSYRGDTKRECKVELYNPDETLFGTLYDANWGADFELPDGAIVGKARRPVRPENEPASEPSEVVHTFMDASEQVVGTCDRHHKRADGQTRDWVWELATGRADVGLPRQVVSLTAPVDATLRAFIFLFPALQYLRHARSG